MLTSEELVEAQAAERVLVASQRSRVPILSYSERGRGYDAMAFAAESRWEGAGRGRAVSSNAQAGYAKNA